MERLAHQVRLALQVPEPVLLVGERGEGKQTVARVIHHQGATRKAPSPDWTASASPPTPWPRCSPALRRAGRRGHRLPAQVCGLPRELQALLCQRLASGGDRPRVIAGLTAPAEELVREGRLLRELAGLLSPLTLDVPPLRQRLDDLPHLIERMLARLQGGPVALSPAAHEVLRGHAWPGNLAELFAVLADSRPRATQGRIDAGDLPASLRLGDRLGREATRPPARRRCRNCSNRWSGA